MEQLKLTKGPTIKAIHTMAINLREKLGCAAFVRLDMRAYSHPENARVVRSYELFINKDDKDILVRKSWAEFQQLYQDLMEGKDVS